MRRRTFLRGALAGALARTGRPQPAAERPHILLVIASDLAAWMLGCYGNQEIQTPNIDRLAVQGVRFENCFVCTPVSSPSRATLFTGRTPMQHGIQDLPVQPPSFRDEVFLSDILAAHGYLCGYFGRWDMGDEGQAQHGFSPWYVADEADLVLRRAIEFMEQARAKKEPWLAVAAYAESAGTGLDDRVGALVDYLEEKKLSEDTLVVFTSDRGHQQNVSDPDAISMREEVIRVPLLMRWLGQIPPGRVRRELVSTYDFMPSMLDLLRLPLPKGRNLCGRSYWPLATSRALGKWDERVYGYFRSTAMLREPQYKLVLRNEGKGPNELCDLSADSAGHANRIEDRALAHVRQSMTRDLNAWIKKYSR
ncbi:MAG: sulfatase-like hydrolase/transferase [Acidobacteria bacterium]|nr:sulfatase-like hydrolase/transferase [Acidobacteriota bacterium]